MDDYTKAYMDGLRQHQYVGALGQAGMGLSAYGMQAAKTTPSAITQQPKEPEFNLVLLTGEDDEA